MAEPCDLVIGLYKQGVDDYWVELRFSQAEAEVETAPRRGRAHFNFEALRRSILSPEDYGNQLVRALLHESYLLAYFNEARAISEQAGLLLRLRLLIDQSAPELHSLRWETLRDPSKGGFLAKNQNILLTRFIYGSDWSQIQLRKRGELRALMVIANPQELDTGKELFLRTGRKELRTLWPVNVADEVERARQALKDLDMDVLARAEGLVNVPEIITNEEMMEEDPETRDPLHLIHKIDQRHQANKEKARSLPTFQNLLERLEQGVGEQPYDILYLVCHGALLPDDPDQENSPKRAYLILEDETGGLDRIEGERLVEHLKYLPANRRPRLAILASCQSAGRGRVPDPKKILAGDEISSNDQGDLAALGPRLAEAGIPAVIAMQDNVKMTTLSQFIPKFMAEMLAHGSVDQAVAAARRFIDERPDWWVPVLYLRLRGGRLWYTPNFSLAKGEKTPDLWAALITNIVKGRCVPVLGFGLLEFLAGSSSEIARRWAESYQFPLEAHNIQNLPQVAQYLAIRQGELFPRDQLLLYIQQTLQTRYSHLMPSQPTRLEAGQLISLIGKARREQDAQDAHRILAQLPFSIYITANPDCLLEEALIENRRPPVVRTFCWRRDLITSELIEQHEQDRRSLKPSIEKPLVYHLFGSLCQEESLVLTEDDYLEFTKQISNPSSPLPVPDIVVRAWREKALLFLGFQLRDWSFRVLYRSLMTAERQAAPPPFKSVAVQLQPGEENLDPESACEYLRQYFPNDKFNVFWGSAEDFLSELWENWMRQGGG